MNYSPELQVRLAMHRTQDDQHDAELWRLARAAEPPYDMRVITIESLEWLVNVRKSKKITAEGLKDADFWTGFSTPLEAENPID